MSSVVSFAKRCCLLYFRDKGAVFFSLMASLIVVMLYLLFLRDSLISGNEGIRDMGHLVDAWVLSGILGITAVTCSAANVWYVDDDNYGSSGDGRSATTAFGTIQEAMDNSNL